MDATPDHKRGNAKGRIMATIQVKDFDGWECVGLMEVTAEHKPETHSCLVGAHVLVPVNGHDMECVRIIYRRIAPPQFEGFKYVGKRKPKAREWYLSPSANEPAQAVFDFSEEAYPIYEKLAPPAPVCSKCGREGCGGVYSCEIIQAAVARTLRIVAEAARATGCNYNLANIIDAKAKENAK